MIPCIIAAPYQGALKVSDLCGELHRVTASRAMQVKCKVSAVWQARLANAEPQPSLAMHLKCIAKVHKKSQISKPFPNLFQNSLKC